MKINKWLEKQVGIKNYIFLLVPKYHTNRIGYFETKF